MTLSHFYHYLRAMLVILYHPNVCSTLVKTPKQTFSSPQMPYRASSIGLVPSGVTSIQLPLVGPSNSVFFSTHSSYRLDKINSDMRNYITNFAADLRWIQARRLPSPYLYCCHVAVVRRLSQLACCPAYILNMDTSQSKHSRPVSERSPGAICSYWQSIKHC